MTSRFLQFFAPDNTTVLATVGQHNAVNNFAVWRGDGKNADGTVATPFVQVFAAGALFGLFDDHDAAWNAAVTEARRLVTNLT